MTDSTVTIMNRGRSSILSVGRMAETSGLLARILLRVIHREYIGHKVSPYNTTSTENVGATPIFCGAKLGGCTV
jgi:hypothetical protein